MQKRGLNKNVPLARFLVGQVTNALFLGIAAPQQSGNGAEIAQNSPKFRQLVTTGTSVFTVKRPPVTGSFGF